MICKFTNARYSLILGFTMPFYSESKWRSTSTVLMFMLSKVRKSYEKTRICYKTHAKL